jgi:hypothetical protein
MRQVSGSERMVQLLPKLKPEENQIPERVGAAAFCILADALRDNCTCGTVPV